MYSSGFKRYKVDYYCYMKRFDNSYIILLLYVDYMLITGAYNEKIDKLKKELSKKFALKDLGAIKKILGMRITRDRVNGILKLLQEKYVKKVFNRLNMDEVKPL